MRNLIVIIAALTALTGCQTGTDELEVGADPNELSEAASSAIAGDMVSRFSEHTGQAAGIIVLREGTSSFGKALSAALRGSGYAIATDQKVGPDKPSIQLAYAVDDFEGRTLARLSTKDLDLTRVYGTTASGASPESPLAVIQRN